MTRYAVAIVAGAMGLAFPVQGQAKQEFEVATVKPADSKTTGSHINLVAGEVLTMQNVTLRQIIVTAYEIQDFQLSGGPDWVNTARWDLTGKPSSEGAVGDDLQTASEAVRKTVRGRTEERLKNLLAERFHLVLRADLKDQPVYFLSAAKNGPKLQAAKDPEGPARGNSSMNNGIGHVVFTSADTAMLAEQLARRTGRPVIDKTGLKGKYDGTLDWTAEAGQPGAGTDPRADTVPTIFTAVQEQLGLRLESQKAPVNVFVIDHVEQPSEN